jgi:hypothetical protein
MSSLNPSQIISDVKRTAQSDQRSDLRLNANGGNSILIVCDPLDELKFITSIREILETEKFGIIDLNQLLMGFIDENRETLDEMFDLLRGSVNQIFKAPSNENKDDFFSKIMGSVASMLAEPRIPVLISTGVLYGAGIDNIQIIENEMVMKASMPIVILYPATHDNERLTFLGMRPASRYRCMIVP